MALSSVARLSFIALCVLFLANVDGKGSPSGSSYGRSSGVYGAGMSSRYYMYPAAGALVWFSMSRNYRNRYRDPDPVKQAKMETDQAQSWRYMRLKIQTNAGADELAEVGFYDKDDSSTKEAIKAEVTNNALQKESKLTDEKMSTGVTGTNLDYTFDLGIPRRVLQYQIGATEASSGLEGKWELFGSNDRSTWSLLDSTGDQFTFITGGSMLVTVLGDEFTCPYGYYNPTYSRVGEPTSGKATVEGRAVKHNVKWTQTVTQYVDCAKACDDNGLKCVAYSIVPTVSLEKNCVMYGSDYTAVANGQALQTTPFSPAEVFCKKSGLVDCQSTECQAKVPTVARHRHRDRRLAALSDALVTPKAIATTGARTHYAARKWIEPFEATEGEFRCGNGKRIARGFFCDQIDDCGDGSDERGCSIGKSTSTVAAGTLAHVFESSLTVLRSLLRVAQSNTSSLGRKIPADDITFATGSLSSPAFTLDLGKHMDLVMVSLRNSPTGAAKTFKLQLADPNSDSDAPCVDASFVTVASGPLPPPSIKNPSSGIEPTTEILLRGHSARCVRFVGEAFYGEDAPAIGLSDINVFVHSHKSDCNNASVQLERRLAEVPTSTSCASCPTFTYPDEGPDVGGIIGSVIGIIFAFFAIAACCGVASKNKKSMPANNNAAIAQQPLGPAVPNKSVEHHLAVNSTPNTLMVTCPPGVAPGQLIQVHHPATGQFVMVPVPTGVSAGMIFGVAMPSVPTAQIVPGA